MIEAALDFVRSFREWADLIGLGLGVVFVLAVLGYFAIVLAASALRREPDRHSLYPCRACGGWTRRTDHVCARCVREGRKVQR